MRSIRNSVKEKNNKIFIPFSFESMMQLFGQNMDRELMNSNMAKQKKDLDKLVKDTSAEKSVIEQLVQDKMENFVKMIEFNNVQENDLSNCDNKLYQKLL